MGLTKLLPEKALGRVGVSTFRNHPCPIKEEIAEDWRIGAMDCIYLGAAQHKMNSCNRSENIIPMILCKQIASRKPSLLWLPLKIVSSPSDHSDSSQPALKLLLTWSGGLRREEKPKRILFTWASASFQYLEKRISWNICKKDTPEHLEQILPRSSSMRLPMGRASPAFFSKTSPCDSFRMPGSRVTAIQVQKFFCMARTFL